MKNQYDIKLLGFVAPPYGGVSIYVQRLYSRLNSSGYLAGAFYIDESTKEAIMPMMDKFKWLSTKHFIGVYRYYSKIIKDYKIIHSHFSLEGMAFLWCFKYLLNKRIVITIHNSMIEEYYNNDKNFINKFFLRWMAQSDVIWITVSKQGKDLLMSLPFKFRNEPIVIPAYIPIKQEATEPLPHTLSDYAMRHRRIITFYGHSFMISNGADIYGFIDALEVYSTIVKSVGTDTGMVYCIADQSDKEKIERLHKEAQKYGVDDLVYWQLGPIKDMDSLWRLTDVYIRPTCTDGDSVAVREAIDLGVNVVASDVCLRPEGVTTYHYGNPSDFFSKVEIALRKHRGKEKANMAPYYSMMDVYNKLLNK